MGESSMSLLKKFSVAVVSTMLTTAIAQAADPTPSDWFNAGRQTVVNAKNLVPINTGNCQCSCRLDG